MFRHGLLLLQQLLLSTHSDDVGDHSMLSSDTQNPCRSNGNHNNNNSHNSCSSSSTGARCSSLSLSSSDASSSCCMSSTPPDNSSASMPLLSSSNTSTCSKNKPHRYSSDPAWAAITRRPSPLGPGDFTLLRRIGSGDIGTVYLCRLRDDGGGGGDGDRCQDPPPPLYAMKVVDKRELVKKKKKMGRAETERRVLKSLDHPFLPTLYADFDASPHYSCIVMEFCPAGDLHSLRHRQPHSRFSLHAARFYAAEVLVALEYLHMLGIVYRDLKPENVLIRSDGHIMLSDFDLSLLSTSSPTLQSHPSPQQQPSSCLPNHLLFPRSSNDAAVNKKEKKHTVKKATKSGGLLRRFRSSTAAQGRRFVAEPVDARSLSFVGTHEYVAPEVAAGRVHGSAVDWWAYGVFLYELLHGRTPFAGPNNHSTLQNILRQPLSFPSSSSSSSSGGAPLDPRARDLISRLLAKDPSRRLGSMHGAAEVKAHPFFAGLKFALLRSQRAPIIVQGNRPKPSRFDHF